MSLKDLCTNSMAADAHINQQEQQDNHFNETYLAIENLFKEDLKEVPTIEDIEADLLFEIQCHIERYSYNINKEDVAKQLYKNYEIMGAE